MKFWLVKFPTSQYEEDVVKLAKDNNLELVDEKFRGSIDPSQITTKAPSLTVKGQKIAHKQRKKGR